MKEFRFEFAMLALIVAVIIGFVIYGMSSFNKAMDPPLEKNFYKWEYSSFCPLTATTDELLQTEKLLRSNGYTRVVIRPKYKETWTSMERVGTEIFATRQLPEVTDATGTAGKED